MVQKLHFFSQLLIFLKHSSKFAPCLLRYLILCCILWMQIETWTVAHFLDYPGLTAVSSPPLSDGFNVYLKMCVCYTSGHVLFQQWNVVIFCFHGVAMQYCWILWKTSENPKPRFPSLLSLTEWHYITGSRIPSGPYGTPPWPHRDAPDQTC